MEYRERLPGPALSGAVQCYWQLRTGRGQPRELAPEPILPDGRIELVFHLGEPFRRDGERQSALLLAGQLETAVVVEPVRGGECFGIRFRPGWSSCFFAFAQGQLLGRLTAWDHDRGARELRQRLGESTEFDSRVRLAEEWLATMWRPAFAPDPRVLHAVNNLSAAASSTVSELARAAGWSPRQLERVFLDQVGLPPKSFARIMRFRRALALQASGLSWADTALVAGYFDQAHMAGDFRRIAGQSPTRLDLGLFD